MSYKDALKLDRKSIDSRVAALKKELCTYSLQSSVSSNEKPHKKRELKKNIAKLLTARQQVGRK